MSYTDILRKRAKKASSPSLLEKLNPYQVLGTPIITEKAYKMVENANIYTFRVHSKATKPDIKAALSYIYDVVPVSVRMINVPYKGRTQRKLVRRAYKKAIVTLKDGDSIELAA